MTLSERVRLFVPQRLLFVLLLVLLPAASLLLIPASGIAQSPLDSLSTEVEEIQTAIRMKGAGWVAGETSLTRLPFMERQKRLGLVMPEVGESIPLLMHDLFGSVPSNLDWRDNGGNFVTPIRNQGSCGSCWAFATTGALESTTLLTLSSPGTDLDLSEQILLSCSRAGNCEQGGSIDQASNFIRDTGLPLESCYSYTKANGSCSNACADWQSSTYRISSWSWVTLERPTVESLKGGEVIPSRSNTTVQ